MALIWSRNKIWGGTFTTDVDVADGTNNASVVPASNFLGLVQGTDTDPRNRSKWFSSVIGQLLRAVLHKEEDRATSANLGVSGAEPTTTKYVTVEQLPSVDKTTNDFTGTAGDGALGATQNTIDITPVLTGTGKSFVGKLHTDFVAWLLARTWLQSDLETLITDTLTNPDGGGIFPVGSEIDRPSLEDPTGWLNMCLGTRTIARASAATATLKDDKYKNLFVFLYLNYSDTLCPVLGGRSGAANLTNANIDWEAGKNIALPDYRGRVSGYYKGSNTNFDKIGKEIGAEILVASDLPATSPYGISVTGAGIKSPPAGGPTYNVTSGAGSTTVYDVADYSVNTASPTNNTGGNQPHFQPTKVTCKLIKY